MQQNQAFIGRQPILDADQQIAAYELLFRHDNSIDDAAIEHDVQPWVEILLGTRDGAETQWMLGDKQAFIRVTPPALLGSAMEQLPAARMVLELLPGLQADAALIQRIKTLREQGFRISLSTIEDAGLLALLPHTDYVKLDLNKLGVDKALALFGKLKGRPVKAIAAKVETRHDFEACQQAGFTLFQGFYFMHPETLAAKVIHPSYAVVLEILNMVSRKAEIREIETAFKHDVALSFKLLRYINSVGFGLSSEIQSIRHAITILGYDQLYRWLTLLMVTAGESTSPPALMKTAITRGRITELLGAGYLNKRERDDLFIVGVFSLLDAMLEMPMEQALDKLNLPDAVTEALLKRSGVYGPFLQLAEACEGSDAEKIRVLAESLVMDPEMINKCHIDALSWTEGLGI
ncbi:MAG TPA: HDOD domain-containing protein [Novimethylophilus sp.]|jgi:EAL and modified HD-GYP domain-containing signal transduction protein|uniref:EAL and HDOD domain-containing protein n=1 Tax=Novimethylophilus sp. TaxID=2137426 RepID=UPI002F427C82